MKLSPDSEYSSNEAEHLYRTYQVQLAALACSSVSVATSIITFYWFCRMDKLFRHRLLMLLIYGDLMRSTWYFVFAVYSLAQGTVRTESKLCQSSGFFIQYGTESSDYAVLVVAIHTALQVFRPASRVGSDGLYKYRYYVYSGGFVIPGIMSALAFVNPESAYVYLGGFCALPLRPFWYRLALTWVPRYLIAMIIVSLACAIYSYVGFEFRSYTNLTQDMHTSVTGTLALSRIDRDVEAAVDGSKSRVAKQRPHHTPESSYVAHDIASLQCKESGVVFMSTTNDESGMGAQSCPTSSTQLLSKRTALRRPPLVFIPSGTSIKLATTNSFYHPVSPLTTKRDDPLSVIILSGPTKDEPTPRSNSPEAATQRQIERQRRRIHRQLRLMFIYPLAYTLMWLIPFIHHCMNYSDYWANHPLWFFRIGSTVCITSMGFVDCLIFSLREKPWRSIQTSDGTVWGSLAVWRSPDTSRKASRRASILALAVTDGSRGTAMERSMTSSARIAKIRNDVRTSGSSDLARLAAGQARTRLEAEKEERSAALALAEKRRLGVFGNGESEHVGLGEKDKGKGPIVA